jgi:hypothetical protein
MLGSIVTRQAFLARKGIELLTAHLFKIIFHIVSPYMMPQN